MVYSIIATSILKVAKLQEKKSEACINKKKEGKGMPKTYEKRKGSMLKTLKLEKGMLEILKLTKIDMPK